MKTRTTLLALAALLGTMTTVDARPMGGPGMGEGPRMPRIDRIIEAHADELGIDDATVAEINQIADAAKPQFKKLQSAMRDARTRMDELMDAEKPDRDAIFAQSEVLSSIHASLKKLQLTTMLDIREKLTAEQWTELRELMPRRDGPPPEGRRGGRGRGPGPGSGPGFDE